MSIEELSSTRSGTEVHVLGNEAVARGAVESGVWLVSSYPGTPSSEIADTLSELSKSFSFEFEYSVNEKVASEVAAAVAMAGGKSMVIFKGAGFFVASDVLFHLAYTGVSGSMVILGCDDPSGHSSADEIDLRVMGRAGSITTFVPSNPAEAKEMTIEAFKLSEKIQQPVMVRMSTRVDHQRGFIRLGEIPLPEIHIADWEKMSKEGKRFAPGGGRSMTMGHLRNIEAIKKAKGICEESKYNEWVKNKSDIGILTCGVAHGYALEALRLLNLNASVFKVGISYPLPEIRLKEFLQGIKVLVVVEELEPYLELYAGVFARDANPTLDIFGKDNGYFPRVSEYDTTVVTNGISRALGMNSPFPSGEIEAKGKEAQELLFPRFPTFCPGCPHRASFYAVKKGSRGRAVFTQDIGCYSLGILPHFEIGDISLCMGASIGIACGLSYISDKPVIGIIGDSTLFHAGLPGLVNAIHTQQNFTLLILDNGVTGMTGFQPHPGTEARGGDKPGKKIIMEDVIKAIGVNDIKIVDSYNVKEMQGAVKDAIAFDGVSVIISRGECAMVSNRKKRGKGLKSIPYLVDHDACNGCWHCIDRFGCPAIEKEGETAGIVSETCNGCGACAQICPLDAIVREN